MITIPIKVVGDAWYNRDQVVDLLRSVPGSPVVLDIGTEGVSINNLGIVQTVLDSGIDPGLVSVANWPNTVESTPFRRQTDHRASHFFWHHQLHTAQLAQAPSPESLFGIFIGRRTPARCKIFYDVYNMYLDSCMSLMNNAHRPNILPWSNNAEVTAETIDNWVADPEMNSFTAWWRNPPVDSIDNHSVDDQYSSSNDTNRDLMLHYHKFAVEIVCETYCYGDTFFPTEKTVRPIAAGKAFVTFGPVDFLKRLQTYGFCTFSDLWDEGYDQLEGAARWSEMQQVLAYIRDQYHKDNKFVAELNNIAAYNRKILQQVVEKYQPT